MTARYHSGRMYYLCLSHEADTKKHFVSLCCDLPTALGGWKPISRISPVVSICPQKVGYGVHSCEEFFQQWSTLFFIGAVNPAAFLPTIPTGPSTLPFLTYGYYNLLLTVYDPGYAKTLAVFLQQRGQGHEIWEIRSGELIDYTACSGTAGKNVIVGNNAGWRENLQEISSLDLAPSTRELLQDYTPLMASALARCEEFLPSLGSELRRFNELLLDGARRQREKERDELGKSSFESLLNNVNAALARFSSQCFSGVSPITLTECHFWVHSLLGIGTATLALQRITSFISNSLGAFHFEERVKRFQGLPSVDLLKIQFDQDPWYADYLIEETDLTTEYEKRRTPMLVYYSRRDGFSQAEGCTLSAPLSSVCSCNALPWSLFNITHEMSHAFTDAILREIIPWRDPNLFQNVYSWSYSKDSNGNHLPDKSPGNFLESIQLFLISIVAQCYNTSNPQKELTINGPEHLKEIYKHQEHQFREIATHLFDFIYFYKKDEYHYVKGIWLSWNIIPELHLRYESYIVRTLAALSVNQLKEPSNRSNKTIDRFLKLTAELAEQMATGHFGPPKSSPNIFQTIHAYTMENRERLQRIFLPFLNLAQFMATVLYSSKAEKGLHASANNDYDCSMGELTSTHMDNPLLYLLEKTAVLESSSSHALCMLSALAYNRSEITP